MPEITVLHIALLVAALLVGLILGWVFRGNRSTSEKNAISAGWQEQLEAQRSEHERLLEQNKSLMEQNSQYQASNRDSKMRAAELSEALKEAFERRDELQRQLKDIRSNLEMAVSERDKLQDDMQHHAAESDATLTALQRRDNKIATLSKELHGWQERVPPLIAKFRARNEEATQLQQELVAAYERIDALESMIGSDQTRVEPVDPDAMASGLDASNQPIDADTAPEYVAPAEDDEAEELLAPDELEVLIGTEVTEDDHDADAAAELRERSALTNVNDSNPTSIDAANSDFRDDLKMIKGVGPAIEKTLNELGIRRFDQIAEMGEYDIDRIAQRLKGFRSRIYREDWIGQARNLHDRKLSDQAN